MTQPRTDVILVQCPCGCTVRRDDESEPHLFLERCLLHDSAPHLLFMLTAWQVLAEESLDFRLALTNLPDNLGVEMLERTQAALQQVEGER